MRNSGLRIYSICFFMLFLLSPLLFSEVHGADEEKKTFTLTLQWLPQAQFAGYYVAMEKGYYKQAGIDLKLLHKPAQESIEKILYQGKSDFITSFLSSGIKLRAQKGLILNIGQISQRSALMFVAHKDSKITRLEDINGKRLGLWPVDFQVIPLALLKKYNLKTEIIPVINDVDLFLWHGVDVMTVMWYNEYHQILDAGINENELVTFFFSDYNMDIPEDGIYCLENTYKNNPDLCKKLVIATLRGWREAFRDRKNTLQIVRKYCAQMHLPFNSAHQSWMLDKMEKLIFPGRDYEPGVLSPKVYKETAKKLMMMGFIKKIPLYADFYKNVLTGDTEPGQEENVKK